MRCGLKSLPEVWCTWQLTICEASGVPATATYGVDLAARPARTAACLIEWRADGRGRVDCPAEGATDTDILTQLANDFITVSAIDSPFGWPALFVESLVSYADAGIWPDAPEERSAQEQMRLRVTDQAVYEETKITPLSVSTDKIGVVAMRCARLLAAHWYAAGQPPDRSGFGSVIEVYPAAALAQWGISQRRGVSDPGTYKGASPAARARRTRIVDAIATAAPWLQMNEKVRVVCIDNDDCLDAMLCALVARACEIDHVLPVTDADAARIEGWIRLPLRGSLSAMGPR